MAKASELVVVPDQVIEVVPLPEVTRSSGPGVDSCRGESPTLYNARNIFTEDLGDDMDVIRHDAPGTERITILVEAPQVPSITAAVSES